MKKRKLFILLVFITLSSAFSQKVDSSYVSQYFFCVRLVNGAGSTIVRYAILQINPKGKKTFHYTSKNNWTLQFSGNQESLANDTTNLFKENKIYWQTLDKLWKVKYSEFPYWKKYDKDLIGWAGKKYAPSKAQMIFLRKYGIDKFITDPIYGDKLIRLLLDMQNEVWITEYSALK